MDLEKKFVQFNSVTLCSRNNLIKNNLITRFGLQGLPKWERTEAVFQLLFFNLASYLAGR